MVLMVIKNDVWDDNTVTDNDGNMYSICRTYLDNESLKWDISPEHCDRMATITGKNTIATAILTTHE